MIKGAITTGEFLSFTLYLGLMIAPIVQMGNIGSQLNRSSCRFRSYRRAYEYGRPKKNLVIVRLNLRMLKETYLLIMFLLVMKKEKM